MTEIRPAIIHLIGQPAAGKFTTANALVALAKADGHHIALVDNHRTGDVILGLLDLTGKPVPRAVWDRVGEVREVVYETIEAMGEPDWSYLFTNVLLEDDPGDREIVERLALVAERTDRRYLPVVLTCDDEELLRRVPNHDRAERHKWLDPDAVAIHLATRPLLDLRARNPLEIDTTSSRPDRTARAVWEALQNRIGGV